MYRLILTDFYRCISSAEIKRIKPWSFNTCTEGSHSDSIDLLKSMSSGLSFQTLHWVFLKVVWCRLSLIFYLSTSDMRLMKILSIWFIVSHTCKLCLDSFKWCGKWKICEVYLSWLKYRKNCWILHLHTKRVRFKLSSATESSTASISIVLRKN